jgi:hypothetical protein
MFYCLKGLCNLQFRKNIEKKKSYRFFVRYYLYLHPQNDTFVTGYANASSVEASYGGHGPPSLPTSPRLRRSKKATEDTALLRYRYGGHGEIAQLVRAHDS